MKIMNLNNERRYIRFKTSSIDRSKMTIFEKITLVNIQRSYGHDETSDKPTNILTHIDPKFIKRRNNFTQFISFALIFFILKGLYFSFSDS